MRDLADRLREQNTGESWRDCEGAGLRHRFNLYPDQVVEGVDAGGVMTPARYYTCTRPSCRVTVRRTR